MHKRPIWLQIALPRAVERQRGDCGQNAAAIRPPSLDIAVTGSTRRSAAVVVGCVAVAALSLVVVAPAPSYDPWSWLLWGREIAGGELHTSEGPAFKPLPVAVCALVSVLGPAAPWAWVLVARIGAVLAVVLAFGLGRRLAGGSVVAGCLAAAGVALCGGYLTYASGGMATGWLLALALAGAAAWRAGRPRVALACGIGCALLQVEAWPFLALLGALLWRRRPQDRPLVAGAAIAVPLLWFVPELIGSGDALRSAERARIPNADQPALADVPAIASLRDAAGLLLWPLWVGLAALLLIRLRGGGSTAALAPAAVGLAWVALVAAMAQLGGFSGEPRYALPGIALIAVSGAVGLTTLGRPGARRPVGLTLVVAALLALAALPRLEEVARLPAAQAYQWELGGDLADAVEAAGGRDAVLRCGQPYVGPLRGPLLAYRLDVAKGTVEPDLPPRAPGVVFRSRRHRGAPMTPAAPASFREHASTTHWRVLRTCRVRMP